MDNETTRWRVILIDGGGQVAGWLGPRLTVVNAAWEALEVVHRTEALEWRRWAKQHIRGGLEGCEWRVEAVELEVAS